MLQQILIHQKGEQVWDMLTSGGWYKSYVEMSRLLEMLFFWLQISSISVSENTILPTTQPREKSLFLLYPYLSVSNPADTAINIFPKVQELLTTSSATILVQVAIISHVD